MKCVNRARCILTFVVVASSVACAATPEDPLRGDDVFSVASEAQRLSIGGTLEVRILDNFDAPEGPRSQVDYLLHTHAGEQVHLRLEEALDGVGSGSSVRVMGRRIGDDLVVSLASDDRIDVFSGGGPTAPTDDNTGTSSAALTATGNHKVAVILYNFRNEHSEPVSPDKARSVMFGATNSVASFYREESFGQTDMQGMHSPAGDVFGTYTIPADNVGCNTDAWSTLATTEAQPARGRASAASPARGSRSTARTSCRA
jgi:hypothetical protein